MASSSWQGWQGDPNANSSRQGYEGDDAHDKKKKKNKHQGRDQQERESIRRPLLGKIDILETQLPSLRDELAAEKNPKP